MRRSLLDLASDEGIYASHRDEAFGCIFGRDTAITALKVLRVVQKTGDEELMLAVRQSLSTIAGLYGKEVNVESGEEPGKFVHEFRKDRYEHLVANTPPWFLYGDETIRNFDSVDATPLGLIALYRYWELSRDAEFLREVLPAVEAGLRWLTDRGDPDGDGLIEYAPHPERTYGGLSIQSWTDSIESFLREDGTLPPYPVAPVEVQAFAWLAFNLWADFYELDSSSYAVALRERAERIRNAFRSKLIFHDRGVWYAAQGIDGNKRQITTITANPLMCLWASYRRGGQIKSIIGNDLIPDFVSRMFFKDLFDAEAGVRTMSTASPTFNREADSYHNGSFWPMLNGLVHEGLLNFGYGAEAEKLRAASLRAMLHFQTPIELYQKDERGYFEYVSSAGQRGCRKQAWSAAAILDMLT